jgi:polysaccharide export outer membrane protein
MPTLRILASAVLILSASAPVYAQTKSPGAAAPAAPAPAPTPEASALPVAVDANFKLGIGDQVSIEVVGGRDAPAHPAVSGDGTVVVPLLGEVKALGMTTAQLGKAIEDGLKKGGFYSAPVVHVSVTGVASRYVTVFGEVSAAGQMPLDRAYHLSDFVSRIGAHTGEGLGTIVLTHANGESKRYTLEDIATGANGGDPLLEAGDKIYVPAVTQELVFVSGQVRSPGNFPLSKNMTVRDAVARAGGLTDLGSDRKLKLFRKQVQIKDVKFDTPLQAGDILEIGEKLF